MTSTSVKRRFTIVFRESSWDNFSYFISISYCDDVDVNQNERGQKGKLSYFLFVVREPMMAATGSSENSFVMIDCMLTLQRSDICPCVKDITKGDKNFRHLQIPTQKDGRRWRTFLHHVFC